jgi:hypothetical protein
MRVEVRGVIYGSVKECADALGVSIKTVYSALDRGSIDNVGSGVYRGGRARCPVEICGHRWPSYSACARDLGETPAMVRHAITKGSIKGRARLEYLTSQINFGLHTETVRGYEGDASLEKGTQVANVDD